MVQMLVSNGFGGGTLERKREKIVQRQKKEDFEIKQRCDPHFIVSVIIFHVLVCVCLYFKINT